jgi:hypothetical protein
MDSEYYRALTRYQYEGRNVILAGFPLAAFSSSLGFFEEQGVDGLFLVATGVGTGELPPDHVPRYVFEHTAESIMDEFRETEKFLRNPPNDLLVRLDEWDPDRRAVLLPTPFYIASTFAGRAVYGWRRLEWYALEDKVVIDEVWDAAGVRRVPSRVVPAAAADLAEAWRELDAGLGVAIAGDALEGFNGGAEYVRWVRDKAGLEEAASFFSRHCRVARVMPFLDGIPCSIHGMVFPDRTVAFRPCELMNLRRPGRTQLHYAGAATFWDPPDRDREEMRAAAVLTGEHLRRRVDYRGGLTVDGVLTEDGFLPTELNTRLGAAFGRITQAVEGFPAMAIQRALIEREDLDYRPDDLERLLVDAADARRSGGGWSPSKRRADETVDVDLARAESGRFQRAEEGDVSVGTLSFGPGAQGSFVRFTANPDHTPVGYLLAERVVEAFGLADRLWDTGFGELEAAMSVNS